MLGKDGDVYRGSGATDASRVTSLCARLGCRQNTESATAQRRPGALDATQGCRAGFSGTGTNTPAERCPQASTISQRRGGGQPAIGLGCRLSHCVLTVKLPGESLQENILKYVPRVGNVFPDRMSEAETRGK